MKTMKNKLLTVFVLIFAIAFTALTVASFGNDAKRVFADGETAFDGSARVTISAKDGASAYDYVSFEYKFDSGYEDKAVSVAIANGWDLPFGNYIFNSSGATKNYAGVSTEASTDGYIKVTAALDGETTVDWLMIQASKYGTTGHGTIRNVEFGKNPEYFVTMAKGASVRKVAPYGIRFRADVPAGLVADNAVSFGMTIIPYDWIVDYADLLETYENDYIAALEFARENYGLKFVKFSCDPVKDGDDYYIQASLTNIKEKNLTREFIGIAWYEKGGVKKYAYDPDCARSIKEVAAKAIIAGEDFNEDQANFVNGIVDLQAYDPVTAKLTYVTESQAVKGKDVLVFYYKKTASGTVRFAVINNADWNSGFYGYFEIADNNTISAAGVTVEAAGNGWYKVTLDTNSMTVTSGDPSVHTYFDTVYFRKGGGAFEVMGLGVEPRPAHSDKIAFSSGSGTSSVLIDAPAVDAYTSVSFDYCLNSVGYMRLGIFNSGNNGGYGYYSFHENGITATGITCNDTEDGWIHVVIDLTKTNTIFGGNEVHEFARIYIRSKDGTAGGYIDNIQWIK